MSTLVSLTLSGSRGSTPPCKESRKIRGHGFCHFRMVFFVTLHISCCADSRVVCRRTQLHLPPPHPSRPQTIQPLTLQRTPPMYTTLDIQRNRSANANAAQVLPINQKTHALSYPPLTPWLQTPCIIQKLSLISWIPRQSRIIQTLQNSTQTQKATISDRGPVYRRRTAGPSKLRSSQSQDLLPPASIPPVPTESCVRTTHFH